MMGLYRELWDEFEQYKAESIKWGINDFLCYDHPTHTITTEQAQVALGAMIRQHDATIGITWDTIGLYIEQYGTLRDIETPTPPQVMVEFGGVVFEFIPTSYDEWQSDGNYDYHYDYLYNEVCVYRVKDGDTDTSVTIHKQPIR